MPTLAWLLIGAIYFYLNYRSWRYRITDRYFTLRGGLFSSTDLKIKISDITRINVRQDNILDKILAIYRVNLSARAQDPTSVPALTTAQSRQMKESLVNATEKTSHIKTSNARANNQEFLTRKHQDEDAEHL